MASKWRLKFPPGHAWNASWLRGQAPEQPLWGDDGGWEEDVRLSAAARAELLRLLDDDAPDPAAGRAALLPVPDLVTESARACSH